MDNENTTEKSTDLIVDTQQIDHTIPEEQQNPEFYVVGIGASAGGLEALEQFFSNMPQTDNMAFVVIQHLSPDYKSFMPELLSKQTKMHVYQIQNGMPLSPGCVYLNPPKYNVTLSNGHFKLVDQGPEKRVNQAVDTFFASLAIEIRECSIGIILSGTGSDGTHGCRVIKEFGGVILAQDESSAKFNGMPKSVVSTKICDYILPPQQMPAELLKYAGHPLVLQNKVEVVASNQYEPDALKKIFNILKKQFSVDFSMYKQSTMLRCIERRMRINQTQDVDSYLEHLIDNPGEIECLYNSLLIGVTHFFRDKEAFNAIKTKVIPEIFASKPDNSAIRVWVAGCSTGEEAYSLAILFREYMDSVQRNMNVKIFATDIDTHSIEYASSGIYPDSISNDVSLERLNRFFIKKKDSYHVIKSIREMVIFSFHNVISNPPFFKIDLLSCRNLLIYFQPRLQTKILTSFQFALENKGFMFLGTSEATGELCNYFTSVEAKWKIFKAKAGKKHIFINDAEFSSVGIKTVPQKTFDYDFMRKSRDSLEMDEVTTKIMEECLPPSIVVAESGELIQVYGEADKFLKVPRGKINFDVQKMVPKELSTVLGTAISKVRKEKKTVTYTNIKLKLGDETVGINLTVKPLLTKKSGSFLLVIFEEGKSNITQTDYVENFDTVGRLQERIADLEQELQYTRESLQTSIEEIETSSEELQSSNEELLVSNEELHSTNEELQSVNEELIIVNNQYQFKIQELADLNNDMTNFLNSTTIGTIFLDSNLCVRKFTQAASREVNLIEADIGRPISHISHNLIDLDLVREAREVMSSLTPSEKEVRSMNGKWYLLKCAPYRTNENMIQGIVISLVDISGRKKAEDELIKSKERYERLINISPFAILILNDNIIRFSNSEGLKLFQVKNVDQLIGKPVYRFIDISETALSKRQTKFMSGPGSPVIPQVEKITRADGTVIYVEIISIPIAFDNDEDQLVIFQDITYRKLSEQLREDSLRDKRLLEEARVFDALKNDFFGNLSHELRTPLNVIMSTLQLLDSIALNSHDSKIGKNLDKYIGIMKQNCFRQLRLINNMIDITKIDSGFFKVKIQNYDIVNIVENITLSVSEYIQSKSIELIFDTDVEEKVIACDPDNIERIMLNLLSNAVKFTDKGGSIMVTMFDKGDTIQVSVKDSGVGIPEEKQNMIFERFRQVDKSLTRNNEGSGIGLSLVKSIVELHGGKIEVISEFGKGSEFIVTLPVTTALDEACCTVEQNETQSHVEKINLEFSDIYNLNIF